MSWQSAAILAGAAAVAAAILAFRFRSAAIRHAKSAARADATFDAAPLGILRHENGVWLANAAARTMLSVDASATLTPDRLARAFASDAISGLRETIAALAAEGTPFEQTLETSEDGRVLSLFGDMVGAVSVIWIRDDSASAWLAEQFTQKEETATLLQGVIDTLPFPVWWRRGEDLTVIGANAAYTEGFGRGEGEIGGLDAGLSDRTRDLARLAQRTAMAQTESRHVVLCGDRRALDVTEAPVAAKSGMIAGVAQDVTGLENLQMTLAEHIAAQDQVLERLTTAIAIFGPDRRLKFFNEPFAKMWRLEQSVLEEQPAIGTLMEMLRAVRQLPEMSDFPAYKRRMESLFTALIDPNEELMHLPDGRTVRSVASPHPLGGLIFQYEDVTDRLALESSHNTLTAVQRSTLNSLFEGVCVFARDGRLKLFNSVYADMFGLDPDWLATEPHISLVAETAQGMLKEEGDWPELKRRLIGYISEPRARQGRMVLADDRVLDYAYVPLPDSQCLVLYLDVTDTTQVEAALRERNRALENADLLKSQFISNVSYELRTPLNAIMGFAELLKIGGVGDLNERQTLYIGHIFAASQTLSDLIGDILDLAAVQAGFMEFETETFDLCEALSDAIDRQPDFMRDRTSLTLPSEVLSVSGDRRRIAQAFRLAIGDALRYGGSADAIAVTVEKRPAESDISVRIHPGPPEPDAIPWAQHAIGEPDALIVDPSLATSSDIGISLARSIILAQYGVIRRDGDAVEILFRTG